MIKTYTEYRTVAVSASYSWDSNLNVKLAMLSRKLNFVRLRLMFVDGKYRIIVILLWYGISTWILEFGKFIHLCLKLSLISFYYLENILVVTNW